MLHCLAEVYDCCSLLGCTRLRHRLILSLLHLNSMLSLSFLLQAPNFKLYVRKTSTQSLERTKDIIR